MYFYGYCCGTDIISLVELNINVILLNINVILEILS